MTVENLTDKDHLSNEEKALKMAGRMKKSMQEVMKTKDVAFMTTEVCLYTDGLTNDYVVPCDEYTKKIIEDCFPRLR